VEAANPEGGGLAVTLTLPPVEEPVLALEVRVA